MWPPPSPEKFEYAPLLHEKPPFRLVCFDLSAKEILTVSICINNKCTFLIDFTLSKALLDAEELGTETLLIIGKRKE